MGYGESRTAAIPCHYAAPRASHIGANHSMRIKPSSAWVLAARPSAASVRHRTAQSSGSWCHPHVPKQQDRHAAVRKSFNVRSEIVPDVAVANRATHLNSVPLINTRWIARCISAARCRVGSGRAEMKRGKVAADLPAIIWYAGINSSNPATTEMPGAIATTASNSMIMPKERF